MAQLATIVKWVSKLNVNYIQNNVICDHCAKNHASVDCQVGNPFAQSSSEQASYV